MRAVLVFFFVAIAGFVQAQTPVELRIDHKVGQLDFNAESEVVTVLGEAVEIDRLEYYLSMFTLVHDGGMETPIDGAYVLADAFEDVAHVLGEVEGVSNVESLKFNVGIDPDNNHADPVAWPSDHPLAPQVPSMHWGWSAGYRFVALEGGAGINGIITHEIHALGDNNHFPGEMEVLASMENGTLVLDVEADVLGFYQDLSVSGGLINHGESGEAVLVCNNTVDHVFRLPGASNVEAAMSLDFGFNLMPLDGGARIQFDAPLGSVVQVELLDLLGRSLAQTNIPSGTRTYDLKDVPAGAFLITVAGLGGRVTRRWVQG